MNRSTLSFSAALAAIALAFPARPALALEYTTAVTFIVPYTVTSYPTGQYGNGPLGIFCAVTAGGKVVGSAWQGIYGQLKMNISQDGKYELLSGSGKANVAVPLSQPVHSGDEYACEIGTYLGGKFARVTRAYNAATYKPVAGTLP